MSSTTDLLIKGLAKTLVETPEKKSSPYDTQAEVRRVEGNIAWVHIPGGVDETPVQLTTNAKPGDVVQVRVSGGRAWLYGNQTAPPTDDTKAISAEKKAVTADENATSALTSAYLAKEAADSAQNSANQANNLLNYMEQAAEEADTTLTGIYQDAKDAKESADAAAIEAGAATISAQSANNAATSALTGLSYVEDVVGVLSWVSTHATYQLTSDDSVVQGKWYFTYDAVNNRYEVVNNPTGNPSAQGWYEIASIDEAVQDYLTSHLALTNMGLWLQTDNVASKLLLSSTDGLVIYGDNGPLAKYGTDAVIGDESAFHIKIDGTEIGFYQAAQKVAYINGNKLYITQSVVLQQMDIGDSNGQWSWKIHTVNGRNNMYLKWLG